MSPVRLILLLIGVHALCDYPLQGEFLARGKNRKSPIPGVPWYHPLLAHAIIHGFGVGLVTRSARIGVAETVAHAVIDDRKCMGKLTYNQDQALHLFCKVLWLTWWIRHNRTSS